MHTNVINAGDLLVATKFSPPRLNARHIVRSQLLSRLRESQPCSATLITGGAGFGKTILLAQWRLELMKAGLDVAWISFSRDDRQFGSFLSYLLEALQRLGIAVEQDWLHSDGSEQSINTLIAIVTHAAQGIDKELHLLMDDFHHVESPAAHRLMQKLLDHCPANLHITLASRSTPALSLGRLRMQGHVVEIDTVELPFDTAETRDFFKQNLSTLVLSADEERLIHDLTSGWPASLQPIATMLRVRPSKRAHLRSILRNSADLQAYLAEDVLVCLSPELLDFMEKVSILRRFNADLGAFVSANHHAPEMIKRAEDENLLIYRIESDDSTPWYRFHPLFGEFLTQRLAARGEGAVQALHRRASQWFAEHEYLVEAVRHANLGGDRDYAIKAMEEAASTTWSMAYISPMLSLLERLPQDTLFAHPQLFIMGCLTYAFTARPEKAQRWLEQMRRSDAARNPAISSKLVLADAAIALQLDQPRRVISLLEAAHQAPLENRSLRYISFSGLATAYLSVGRAADARKLHEQYPIDLQDRANDMAMVFESTQALARLKEGNARQALSIGEQVIARAEEAYGRGSVSANLCAATLCDAYYELDQLDDALRVLANRSGILRSSMPDVMIRASLCRARITLQQDSPQAALSFLDTQGAHFQVLELDRLLALILAEQVRVLVLQGESRRAAEVTGRLTSLAAAQRPNAESREEINYLVALSRVRLALAAQDGQSALDALAAIHAHVEQSARGRSWVRAHLLSAQAHALLGQTLAVVENLQEALASGVRMGLVRTLLDEGQGVLDLLATHLEAISQAPAAAEYVQALLNRKTPVHTPAPLACASRSRVDSPRASLTPRELEILGLVAQAMSNKRIALTLNITFGTVKWNVKNILAKLGVSSRYAAITLARQQGLLE
ncbi:LuxR C-terminal-related transcriptional regulator [Pseudomonas alkylphenolica]|uniref:LuxR C-terminal-related transcriptional regulator n=1 Tax=Pseudomonas alkylphenolica TaxID=237609 RepID=UPI0018D8BF77|nr:LuxR C-terminal-related transcriptional regulator [Pseudomonas alkylphenolica]MBH3429671.1 ATP-dependent transcriptional regulator [Pseudomonas alkylphenolica]